MVSRRNLIVKSKIEYTDYAINHYLGCVHNCKYCYARRGAMRFKRTRDWTTVQIADNPLTLLDKDLKKIKEGIVLVSSFTDPYQPIEKELKLTRFILKHLSWTNLKTLVLTKSDLFKRDLDLNGDNIAFGITMTTLFSNKAELWEPVAPPPSERINALREAKDRGFKVWVSLEPIIPNFTEVHAIIDLLSWTDWFVLGKLNYFKEGNNIEWYKTIIPKAVEQLEELGIKYFIKKELAKIIPELEYRNRHIYNVNTQT